VEAGSFFLLERKKKFSLWLKGNKGSVEGALTSKYRTIQEMGEVNTQFLKKKDRMCLAGAYIAKCKRRQQEQRGGALGIPLFFRFLPLGVLCAFSARSLLPYITTETDSTIFLFLYFL